MVICGDGQVGRIFSARGFPRTPSMPSIPMRELVESWEGRLANAGVRWIRWAVPPDHGHGAQPVPYPALGTERGADRMGQTWYGPVVRYVKKISSRRCEEVDVVFCKFELDDGGRPKIGIREVLPGE